MRYKYSILIFLIFIILILICLILYNMSIDKIILTSLLTIYLTNLTYKEWK